MKIIQIGMEKSGNLWLWRIIESILARAGIEKKSFIKKQPLYDVIKTSYKATLEKQDIDSIEIHKNVSYYFYPFTIDDVDKYINSVSHVWCHSLYNDGSQKILSRFDKIVYIVRDPRDMLVSFARYVFNPVCYQKAAVQEDNPTDYIQSNYRHNVRRWVQHVGRYLRHKNLLNIHFIFYERLLYEFDSELKRLLEYLKINLNENEVQAIKHEVSFASMQKRNPDHLTKGAYGQWLEALTNKQKNEILNIAGPLLHLLNYPEDDKDALQMISKKLPSLPHSAPEKQIAKLMYRSSRPTFSEMTERLYKMTTA